MYSREQILEKVRHSHIKVKKFINAYSGKESKYIENLEDFLLEQSFRFMGVLFNDILGSNIGLVVKQLLKFRKSLIFRTQEAPKAYLGG